MLKVCTIILTLAALICQQSVPANANANANANATDPRLAVVQVPKMVFDKNVLDFGSLSVSRADKKTLVFTFVNKGNAPLVIENVKTNCGCTTAEFPHKPVKPGKKGKIKVTINAALQEDLGVFGSLITIYHNSPQQFTRIRAVGKFLD